MLWVAEGAARRGHGRKRQRGDDAGEKKLAWDRSFELLIAWAGRLISLDCMCCRSTHRLFVEIDTTRAQDGHTTSSGGRRGSRRTSVQQSKARGAKSAWAGPFLSTAFASKHQERIPIRTILFTSVRHVTSNAKIGPRGRQQSLPFSPLSHPFFVCPSPKITTL